MRWVTLSLVGGLLTAGCAKKSPVEPAAASAETPAPTTEEDAQPATADAPASTSAPAAPAGPSVSERLDRAVALLTTGSEPDTLRARKELKDLADQAGDDPLVQLNLGVAYHRLGDLERAASAFSTVTRLAPDDGRGWLYLGQVELQLDDAASALRHLRKGIGANPDDLALRAALARAELATGSPTDAINTAKDALKIDARHLPLYDVMGLAYLEQGDVDMARFVYEKALQLPGGDGNANIVGNFGWTLHVAGERYAALKQLQDAVALAPGNIPVLVRLSRLYMADENHADALPLLERARDANPGNFGILMNLGTAYRGVGRTDDARLAWERALELEPRNPDPHFNLAILLGDDLKQYDEAITAYQTYLSSGGTQRDLANAYIEDIEREKKKADRRRKREEDRKQREAEREAERKLLEQAEAAGGGEEAP